MDKEKKQYSIGVDIGGTNMKAVLFDGEKVISDYILGTPKDNLEHFIIMLNALIDPLIEKAREDKIKVKGIGVGIAGIVNKKEKEILASSPNLNFLDNGKIIQSLHNKFDLSVEVDNDVNCFLRAEIKIGAGVRYNNVYGITIGTGIGGAWWFNDDIYRGSHNGAGEPGRMIIDFAEQIDLENIYHKLSQNNPANLAEEAYRGDILAEKSFQEIGVCVGVALANIINLIDPEIIIIGGGAIEANDLFIPQAKKNMRKYVMNPESKKIKILKGKIGENAGAIGAAFLVQ